MDFLFLTATVGDSERKQNDYAEGALEKLIFFGGHVCFN